jgi:hypothetical protein
MKKFIFYLSAFLFLSFHAFSQSDIDQIIKGNAQDANTLVKGYVSPALSLIAYGLNQGWYNTAKPHKIAGVDITTTINLIKVPTSDLTYYIDNTKLNNVERLAGPGGIPQSGLVPTVFGSDQSPTYDEKVNNVRVPFSEFSGAPGVNLSKVPVISNSVPIPMAQIGFGLPKGFDLKVRFIPTIKFNNNNSDFGLFGIGIMHDVKQYIPGIKNLPFDLSGFVGYTKMTLNVAFDPQNHPDQKAKLSSNATTIQGVISKKFSVLTGYAGLGYNIASSTFDLSGKYDVSNTGNYVAVPVNITGSDSGPRATFGMRLKLAVFTFHGEYTLQKYSALTLGFGISVR